MTVVIIISNQLWVVIFTAERFFHKTLIKEDNH